VLVLFKCVAQIGALVMDRAMAGGANNPDVLAIIAATLLYRYDVVSLKGLRPWQ
jgi:hypothetical protein